MGNTSEESIEEPPKNNEEVSIIRDEKKSHDGTPSKRPRRVNKNTSSLFNGSKNQTAPTNTISEAEPVVRRTDDVEDVLSLLSKMQEIDATRRSLLQKYEATAMKLKELELLCVEVENKLEECRKQHEKLEKNGRRNRYVLLENIVSDGLKNLKKN